jgi:hypothetical protein
VKEARTGAGAFDASHRGLEWRGTSVPHPAKSIWGGGLAHRTFIDSRRVTWDVWEVGPTSPERRSGVADRRHHSRAARDRRRSVDVSSMRVSGAYAQGWLAFESKHDKRRLAPVPEGWEEFDDRELGRLVEQARPAGRPRRLIE